MGGTAGRPAASRCVDRGGGPSGLLRSSALVMAARVAAIDGVVVARHQAAFRSNHWSALAIGTNKRRPMRTEGKSSVAISCSMVRWLSP